MIPEFWFYATTVLICTGYAFLMQSYPQWKLYFSVGLLVFIIAGAVLVYFDAKKREDIHTKMQQLEHDLEAEKKETAKQESLLRDASNRAHLLGEQLKAKSDELSKVLHDKPQIIGEIKSVRLFPWQRASARPEHTAAKTTAAGIVVFARIENEGSETTLANWELTIELPDHTVIRPQRWPVKKSMRIPCDDGPIKISSGEYLDAKTRQAVQRTQELSGVTVWMIKQAPLSTIQDDKADYTLTARDNTGVVHALKPFNLTVSPQPCFGFDVMD
ncbi:MAG TPA: hypothetical protein VL261_10550 [Nitrospira sp.]|jgi:hypothetical protein|nr:hypothetical protein [Nitrospira sp.]